MPSVNVRPTFAAMMNIVSMKRMALFMAAVLCVAVLDAQQNTLIPPPPAPDTANISNVLEAFQHGHFQGSFRSFLMVTDNARNLTDYYAWAVGGGLHFHTAAWHGFSFGLGGAFNFNVSSSDLGQRDPATGALNRYEIGLFDVENPNNRNDLDRLEELWLRYEWKNARITLGQQALQTPFINYQDGRMRPTTEAGIWSVLNPSKNTKIEAGWLWKISPRSTVHWYPIGESIGLYPKGLNPDGTSSGYPANLRSNGIGMLGVSRQWGKNTKIQFWDQYVDQIFNTTLVQADYIRPLQRGNTLLLGAQWTHQNAVANGGNPDPSKSYFEKNARSNTFSMQAGWKRGGWKALTAYTRITAEGRFLSPREWGREPFYTFMSRERIEGSGNVQAVSGRLSWQSAREKWLLEAGYGHFYLPDVHDSPLNKYAFPAYRQFNFDARYTFGGALEGLRAQFLYVWKGRLGEVYGNDKYVINRVNVSLYNLIFNYTY